MRIGLIGSIWISVPPKGFGFGAQEYLAYYLVEMLKKKGHEVTLFASGDSHVSTNLVSVSDKQVIDIPSKDEKIKDIFELMNISEAYKRAKDFDVFHNHLLPYGLLFPEITRTPTVHTLHHAIYNKEERADYYLYQAHKHQNYVSISNAQRRIVPDLNYVSTVYNGIDPDFYTFKEVPEGKYLLYIGRLKRYKGIHTAIKISKTLDIPLKIATNLPLPSQPDYEEVNQYWENEIQPEIGSKIEHIVAISGKEKVSLIQNAKALLFPVERMEPFGMTIIESMSCGTPVIAYTGGAIPELVIDGKTGFIINYANVNEGEYQTRQEGFDGLLEAVKKIYSLSEDEYKKMRLESRKHTENNYTVGRMVDKYEEVYLRAIEQSS